MIEIPDSENQRSDSKERIISAPCETVFQAFSNPGQLARWWGPKGFTNSIKEFDLRKGGYWHLTMHGADGKNYPNESRFLEVVENERIVIEHFSNHHFILTITFTSKDNSTLVGWHQMFDTAEHYQQISEFVSNANEQNLDRLEAVISESENLAQQTYAVGLRKAALPSATDAKRYASPSAALRTRRSALRLERQ
jgi:hypothetical protein